ncbi:hypothetical protein GCM10010218_58390 [Streptomyces mashuensis]|uniref:DUF4190 domain-containing protein n=1 Tax=Streptomyces mashuensis TaxID=33904 RepID=A0A919EF24_9ACTN|nr:CD225/dispanin family protein [Streptomyces mashuensis]GHF69312.1 hypothetical protein GCM10010218_58390 [Streptomyces mashuensis]
MSQEQWPGRPPPEDRGNAGTPPPPQGGGPTHPGYPPPPSTPGGPGGGAGPQYSPPQGHPPNPPPGAYQGQTGWPPQQPGYSTQPGGYPPRPASHLGWAIVSLILFWPLGIPAVIFAAQVNGKYASGDLPGAEDSSGKARLFALIATIIGVVLIVLTVLLFVVAGFWATDNVPDTNY